VLLFSLVKGTLVCEKSPLVVLRAMLVPPKNQTRSCTIGPPTTASYVGDSFDARVTFSASSRRVSSLHAEFEKLVRNPPAKTLLPLFVTTLTTPPAKRPYSALTPDESTCTSSIPSSM